MYTNRQILTELKQNNIEKIICDYDIYYLDNVTNSYISNIDSEFISKKYFYQIIKSKRFILKMTYNGLNKFTLEYKRGIK